MFLAFINGVINREGEIQMPLNKDFVLKLKPSPGLLWADFGYFEPKSKKRQDVLNEYEETEEEEG